MKDFFKNFASLDEQKVSTLIISLLIFVGFGAYKMIVAGDVPVYCKNIIEVLASLIAGVNGVNIVGQTLQNKFSNINNNCTNDNVNTQG